MLSGIGVKDQLAQSGIESKGDSSYVGQNLRNHPIMPHVPKIKDAVGLDGHLPRAGYMRKPLSAPMKETTRVRFIVAYWSSMAFLH